DFTKGTHFYRPTELLPAAHRAYKTSTEQGRKIRRVQSKYSPALLLLPPSKHIPETVGNSCPVSYCGREDERSVVVPSKGEGRRGRQRGGMGSSEPEGMPLVTRSANNGG